MIVEREQKLSFDCVERAAQPNEVVVAERICIASGFVVRRIDIEEGVRPVLIGFFVPKKDFSLRRRGFQPR